MRDAAFNLSKLVQVASVIVGLEGWEIDRLRLLKLLYLADRESLRERGTPIVGGQICALDDGPVHREVFDMIETDDCCEWSDHFRNKGYKIISVSDPGTTGLSRFEISILYKLVDRFQEMDTWRLVERTRDLDEWKACWNPGTSAPIPLATQLAAIGFSAARAEEIVALEDYYDRFAQALESNASSAN